MTFDLKLHCQISRLYAKIQTTIEAQNHIRHQNSEQMDSLSQRDLSLIAEYEQTLLIPCISMPTCELHRPDAQKCTSGSNSTTCS